MSRGRTAPLQLTHPKCRRICAQLSLNTLLALRSLFTKVFATFLRCSEDFLRRLPPLSTSAFHDSCPDETPRSYPNGHRSTRISLSVPLATQFKRRLQCLAIIKLLGGAIGCSRGRPLVWPAVRRIHIATLPNRTRLGMRLGKIARLWDCQWTFGDSSRLSRERKVRLRPASNSAFPNGMTSKVGDRLGSIVAARLYSLTARRPFLRIRIAGHSHLLPRLLSNTFFNTRSATVTTHYDKLISTPKTRRCFSPLSSPPGLPRP